MDARATVETCRRSVSRVQIRFGDFNEEHYRSSFLADGLHMLVPRHLLHNQLKTTEWQRRASPPACSCCSSPQGF